MLQLWIVVLGTLMIHIGIRHMSVECSQIFHKANQRLKQLTKMVIIQAKISMEELC